MLRACVDLEPTASEENLAASAAAGATSAFVVLLARHQDRVYRFAIRMCHNAADAEDIAQETFILAHRGIGSFHGDSRFSTWLYRIAFNQVLMRRRAARRRPVQSIEVSTPEGGWAGPAVGAESQEGAEELVDQKVLALRVRAALATLDDSHRAALVLRDLEGLSADEAADILGVSADAVRQRAHRARLKLREELGELVRAPDSRRGAGDVRRPR